MVSKWTNGYVIGPYSALKQWELDTWPSPPSYDEDGNLLPVTTSSRPHSAFRATPARVLMQDGVTVDEETGDESPVYIPDPDRSDVLVLFSLQAEELPHLDELDAMLDVTVLRGATRADILDAFPEFSVGQSIPYLS